MREHYANIWPVDQLRAWHVLTAACGTCRHTERLSVHALQAQHPEFQWLHEFEPWLVCTRCGNRQRNRVDVAKIERNY